MLRLLIFVFSVVVATSCATAQETETPSVETLGKITRLKTAVCVKLEELLDFKDDAKFKQFGFGRGGPYYKWLAGVQKLRDEQPKGISGPVPFKLRVTPGELMQIGMDYMQEGKETRYIRQILPELKTTIDYSGYLRLKEIKKNLARVQKQRTWTDKSGKYSVVATLTKFDHGKLTLSKKDGGTVTLSIQKLSENDRQLLGKAYPGASGK